MINWAIKKNQFPTLACSKIEDLVQLVPWRPICNHYSSMDHSHSISVYQLMFSLRPEFTLFPHSLTSPVPFLLFKRASLSSHLLAPSIRHSPLPHRLACKQTQLAIMMTNQPKYLCPLSFTLALPTARPLLFCFFPCGSPCAGHRSHSQTIVIALHIHLSAPIMSPKHHWLLMSAEDSVYGCQRSGINIGAYVDFCVGPMSNLFCKWDVPCIF